jgi:hypothetical protein
MKLCSVLAACYDEILQSYSTVICFQVAELQEKVSKAVEENQKLQGKLLLLTREKQAIDKKVICIKKHIVISSIIMMIHSTNYVFISSIIRMSHSRIPFQMLCY